MRRLIDGRVLDQAFQPFVGGRLEAEKNVEFARDRPPCLEQIGMTGDEIDPALDEDPLLADPRRRSSGQLEAARGVIPEQIVGDEDFVAAAGEVRQTDSIERSRTPARAAARSNRTSSGTGSRAPSRSATSDDVRDRRTDAATRRLMAGRSGTSSSANVAVRLRSASTPPSRSALAIPGISLSGRPFSMRIDDRRQRALTVVQHDGVDVAGEEWRRVRGRGMAPDDNRAVGAACGLARELEDLVGLERVHRGDADETGRLPISQASDPENRKSARRTSSPRASSAAAMYSIPSGSMRKNGPRPKRSLRGTGRSRRTRMT